MEIIKTGTNIATVKISDLPKSTETAGRATLAIDEQTNASEALELTKVADATQTALDAAQTANQSSQTALDAAGKANQAAQNADDAREEMAAVLAGKADLDDDKKYIEGEQLNPLSDYQTAVIVGGPKGYFKSDSPALVTSDQPSTLIVCFVQPASGLAVLYDCNMTSGSDVPKGEYIVTQDGKVSVFMRRSIAVLSKAISTGKLCMAAVSYTPNGRLIVRINEGVKESENPSYSNPYEPTFMRFGAWSTGFASMQMVSVRRFDFAMTAEQLEEAWNGGRPELWKVPDKYRNGEVGARCFLDLNPKGLLPNVWRDMSVQGNDVPFYPMASSYPTECEFSYETYETEFAKAESSVMYGMQTGAVMGKGIFQSDASPLLFDGDRTFRVLIKTGSDVTTSQTVFKDKTSGSCMTAYLSGGSLLLYPKGIGTAFFNIRPNKLYECVLVNKGEQAYAYLNNVKKESSVAEDFAQPNTLIAGGIVGAATPFLGTFISLQLFNFAFSDEDAAASWNNGHPELWRVPDEFRAHEIVWPIDNVAESQNVFLGNNPSQITTTQNVPQENGFSGAFQRFADASQAPSVYCNLWIYKYNRAPIRLTIEYRSTSDLYSDTALTKLLLPANTGDAKTVTLDVIDGVYGGAIYAKTTDDTFEIRTIKAEEIGCILDLNAHGLLPTVWRDTSGHGNDLPYSPSSGNPDTCELSYERHGFEEVIIGTAAPTVTPDFIGQKFIDTTNKVTYTAYGTTNSGDWK